MTDQKKKGGILTTLIAIVKSTHCVQLEITDTRIRMLIEKSVIDRGLGLLQLEGDFDTKFVTWSVCPVFSQGQYHLHPPP